MDIEHRGVIQVREIKFRGFYKSIKEMEYYDTVAFLNFEEDVLCYQKSPENEPRGFSDMSGIELMQFSGLIDMNGKEIYEGDILDREGYWGYYVGFEQGQFVCIPVNNVQRINWDWNPLKDFELDYWEVIGNIYENPELRRKWNE